MSDETQSLLLRSLIDSDSEAAAAWKAWRSAVDIQHLTWAEMQILPVLNGPRLEEWLTHDPASGILKGIVRRAWSEAQVRLGQVCETVLCLRQAGCATTTVIGAAGTYLRSLHATAIRPILELRVLIDRQHLGAAAAALEAEGWQPRDPLPSGEWLDRQTYLLYNRNGTRLYLHWRLLNLLSLDRRRTAAWEEEVLSDSRTIEAIGTEFQILSPSAALIEALGERDESVDALAWQADARLICREQIAWPRWAWQAARYQPQILERIGELRSMGLDIPAPRGPRAWMERLALGEWLESSCRKAGIWRRRISTAMGKA